MLTIHCPVCGATGCTPNSAVGSIAVCEACGTRFTIPKPVYRIMRRDSGLVRGALWGCGCLAVLISPFALFVFCGVIGVFDHKPNARRPAPVIEIDPDEMPENIVKKHRTDDDVQKSEADRKAELEAMNERTRLAILKFEQEARDAARAEKEAARIAKLDVARKEEAARINAIISAVADKASLGTPEWVHGLAINKDFHRKKLKAVDIKTEVSGNIVTISWVDLEFRTASVTTADLAAKAKLGTSPDRLAGRIEAVFLLADPGRLVFLRVKRPPYTTIEARESVSTGNRLYGWHKLFSETK